MDAFSYHDIFDTKGIEYLVVIGFLSLLVPLWIWLNKPVKTGSQLLRSIQGLSESILKIPLGLYFNRNHTWTFMQKDGTAKIGLDDLMLHMTGGVSVEFLKGTGERVKKGEKMAVVRKEDRAMFIGSPVSGEIRKQNPELAGTAGLINNDPYGNGWLYMLKPDNWKEDVKECRLDDEAVAWTGKELTRCRDFLSGALSSFNGTGDQHRILQTGGELIDFPLADLPSEIWQKFQNEFLD